MRKLFRSFSAGELSEEMYDRQDVDKHGSGCRILKNCLVMPQGGAFRAPGTKFAGMCGDMTRKVITIPFKFSDEISVYTVEFGHLYARFYANREQVTFAAQNITGITVANPGVVTITAHGYSNGDEVFISGVGGMWQVNGRNFKIANVTANTFELRDMFGNPFSTVGFNAYTSGGTAKKVYIIPSPYTENQIESIYYSQTASVMTLAHPDLDPYELVCISPTNWTLQPAVFVPSIAFPTALTAVNTTGTGSTVYRYKVTAIASENGEESYVGVQTPVNISAATQANPCAITTAASHGLTTGDEVLIRNVVGMTNLNDNYYTVTVTGATTFTLNGVNSTSFPAYVSGGNMARTHAQCSNDLSVAVNENTISWSAVAGAERYNVFKSESGTYGYIGTSESLSFVDDNIKPDGFRTPPRKRVPFAGPNNKPAVVGYADQRRIFARTPVKPDTIFMTKAGAFNNFSTSTPTGDDDAITFALSSGEVNKINHILPFKDLLIMTGEREFRLRSADGVITPTSISAPPETGFGSTTVKPIVTGNTALFVARYGRSVRDYQYTLESDGYNGNDLTVMAKHLFETRSIKSWAFAQEPDRVVWCVMTDGTLLSLTYMLEHRVWGWARHETDGEYEWVNTIPNAAARRDDVYFVVKRVINGVTHRFIEVLMPYEDRVKEDCFFVHSGLTYDGAATNEIRGLWHLEGKTVDVLADGQPVPPKVVSGGKITLLDAAEKVTAGLNYVSELSPLAVEGEDQTGTTRGEPKQVKSILMKLIRTTGVEGKSDDRDTIWQPMNTLYTDFDLAKDFILQTGIIKIAVGPRWSRNETGPILRQRYPLPFKITSMVQIWE